MIDLVLPPLDHHWGPPLWFNALKSIPVIHFGHFRNAWIKIRIKKYKEKHLSGKKTGIFYFLWVYTLNPNVELLTELMKKVGFSVAGQYDRSRMSPPPWRHCHHPHHHHQLTIMLIKILTSLWSLMSVLHSSVRFLKAVHVGSPEWKST